MSSLCKVSVETGGKKQEQYQEYFRQSDNEELPRWDSFCPNLMNFLAGKSNCDDILGLPVLVESNYVTLYRGKYLILM